MGPTTIELDDVSFAMNGSPPIQRDLTRSGACSVTVGSDGSVMIRSRSQPAVLRLQPTYKHAIHTDNLVAFLSNVPELQM